MLTTLNITSRVTTATGFRATFIGSESKLYLHLPSEGRVKVVDLQGRQILSQVISNNTFIKDSHYGIKLNVPAGTYIVNFKGINQTAEQMVSIL